MDDTNRSKPPPTSSASHSTSTSAAKAQRLLIVDDKAFARSVIRRALDKMGYTQVDEAGGGLAAIEAVKSAGPAYDVVICDIIMPDVDGIQLLREFADLERPPQIILASGSDSSVLAATEELAKTRGLKVLGVLKKPVSKDALDSALSGFEAAEPAATKRSGSMRQLTKGELADGLESDAVTVFYQPKVELKSGAVTSVEALVRWRERDGSILPPAAFISVAEDTGLIRPLTEKVVAIALDQCSAWNKDGLDLKVSVNMSAQDLNDVTFPDEISETIDELGVPVEHVIVEVTETGLFQDLATSLDVMTRLHLKGIKLSIDDFGTGYSSMGQLQRIPFSELKVDRAFVTNAGNRPKALAILKASVDLAQRLGIGTTAEGIETADDWALLEDLGIDVGQGFYIAKPMPAEDVPGWVESWQVAR